MLKLKRVAVTGGLSCGKSSVCRILKECGAYVVSADKIVHQLLSSDTNLGQEVVKLLGSGILVNQKIDRSRIADIVFHDMELLQALEELIHPAVYKELDQDYQRQQKLSPPPPLFVAEIPLLFESGRQKEFDFTIVVVANLDHCLYRFKQMKGGHQIEFDNRVARQLPLSDKAKLADYVIVNNSTLFDLQQVTQELYQELIKN